MEGLQFRIVWCAGLIVGIAASILLAATEVAVPQGDATPGILLLNNGNLLEGTIAQSDGFYVLTTPTSEVRLRADRVLFVGSDRVAAYEFRRAQMAPPTAERHLELAAWCLRYELWPQMARELMDARTMNASPAELARLEQQLEVATNLSHRNESRGEDLVHLTDERAAQRKALEAVPKDISDEALDLFMRKVQPILVNNCATSGCHQATNPGGSEFQLDRALVHGQSNRQTTLRNLAAALDLVDEESPMQSQLLTIPVRPHGTMKQPIFSSRQAQLRRHLEDWVRLVTHVEEPDVLTAGAVDASQTVDRAVWIVPDGVDESVYRRLAPAGAREGAKSRSR